MKAKFLLAVGMLLLALICPCSMMAEEKGGAEIFGPELFDAMLEEAMNGDVRIMRAVAHMYALGIGTEPDADLAAKWYTKAAEAGDVQSMTTIGTLYMNGILGQDYAKALEWLERAEREGDTFYAPFQLGEMYANAYGVEQDYERAFGYYKKAADAGNLEAMSRVGLFYCTGSGVEADTETGKRCLAKGAEQGNASSMYFMGQLYEYGVGEEIDYKTAMKWYQDAANAGNVNAMVSLGDMYCYGEFYYKGIGFYIDNEHAVEWYTEAAKNGSAKAMGRLGDLYMAQGVWNEELKETAFKWHKLAAENGHVPSMTKTAIEYEHQRNYELAAEWFEKAALMGDGQAMHYLGRLYRDGNGVQQDREYAKQWMRMALEAGWEDAAYDLEEME